MSKKKIFALLLMPFLVVAVAGIAFNGGLPAEATNHENGMATMNVVHGIPEVAADVCARGQMEEEFSKVAQNLEFTDIEMLTLSQGAYDIAVVRAGEDCASPIIGLEAQDLSVASGDNLSIIAHLTEDGEEFTLTTGLNDTARPVDSNLSLITVYHAAAAPRVDVRVGKFHPVRQLFTFMGNGEFGAHELLPENYRMAIVPAGGPPTEALAVVRAMLSEDSNLIIYAVGSPDEDNLFLVWQVIPLEEMPAPAQ